MSYFIQAVEFHVLLAAELPFFFTHLMPLALVLVGGSTMLGAVASLLQAIASYRWLATPGRVMGASVEESSGGGETEYTIRTAKLGYTYEVNGETHVGTRVTLADRTLGSGADAAAFLSKYPKDAAVVVRYHPQEPARSVLRPGICFGNITGFFFPLLFLAGGVYLFLLLPKLHHYQ